MIYTYSRRVETSGARWRRTKTHLMRMNGLAFHLDDLPERTVCGARIYGGEEWEVTRSIAFPVGKLDGLKNMCGHCLNRVDESEVMFDDEHIRQVGGDGPRGDSQ